jgi:hypothetical protein
MRANNLFLLASALVACLLPQALEANTRESDITLDLTFLSLGVRIPDLRFMNNGAIESLNVFDTTRSNNIRYIGPQNLTFYRKTGLDVAGNPIHEPIGEIMLQNEPSRQLILLWEQTGAANRYSARAIDDNLDSFPIGSFQFVNLCTFPLQIRLGKEEHGIDRGASVVVAGDFNHGEHYQALMVSLVEGEVRPAYSSMIYFNQRARTIYFILPRDNSGSGRVRLIGIPQSERRLQSTVSRVGKETTG